jgi:predicted ATPase
VPLFLEELTKTVLESGLLKPSGDRFELDGPLPPLAIPATLHDSLTARLDRLSPVKEVAQIGATIGREFAYELLTAVASSSEAELQDALNQLVDSEMIFARGSPPLATYTFKHALVRDAAYSTLLRAKRQQIHAKIARVIEARYAATAETQPELLAHHLTEAGLLPEAIAYWHRAGERSMRRSANLEAAAQLARGIELQHAVPASAEGKQRELDMQILLAQALIATKGYAAEQTGQAFERALELVQSAGTSAQKLAVLHGLYARHLVGGRLDAALERARNLLAAVEDAAEPCAFYPAHRALGTTLLYRGELIEAKVHIERAISRYDPQAHASAIFQFHRDMAVTARSLLSWTLWLMGYPAQAGNLTADILADARRLGHAHSLGYALFFSGITLQMFCGNLAATREHTREMLELANQHGLALWSVTGSIVQAWLSRNEGEPESAAQQIRADLTAYRDMGSGVFRPLFLQLLADVLTADGKVSEALRALDEALLLVASSGERWQEAELHRVRGEMLLISPERREDAAESCLQTALTIARAQSARSWELRAAMSLARLWNDRGRREAAHALLAPVYGSFREGHDTADLRQARALLGGLARAKPPARRRRA